MTSFTNKDKRMEKWKDVLNYEGIYQVSSLGRVKSMLRKVKHPTIGFQTINEKILKISLSSKGYHMVRLCRDGICKTRSVHQLVAESFLSHTPCRYKRVVDHINGKPSDNRVENLQIISNRKNLSKDKNGGSSKFTGVSWDRGCNKWVARIRINSINTFLGRFADEEDASEAYQNKLIELRNKP